MILSSLLAILSLSLISRLFWADGDTHNADFAPPFYASAVLLRAFVCVSVGCGSPFSTLCLPSAHPLKFCLYFLLVSANHAHPCPLTNPLPATTYVSLPSSSAPSPFSLSFSLPLPYLRSLPIADCLVPTGKESSLSHHTLFKTSNPEHVAEPLHNERISLSCHRSSLPYCHSIPTSVNCSFT